MSKNWDELKEESSYRMEIEKEWSRAEGFLESLKKQNVEGHMNFSTLIYNFRRIDRNIGSLREGLIQIETRIAKIETRLEELEGTNDLDEHR